LTTEKHWTHRGHAGFANLRVLKNDLGDFFVKKLSMSFVKKFPLSEWRQAISIEENQLSPPET
jgi:hypothetical protein